MKLKYIVLALVSSISLFAAAKQPVIFDGVHTVVIGAAKQPVIFDGIR